MGEWAPPQEWRGSSSTIGFGHKGNYNLGNGGSFTELKLVKFFYDLGVVVLNLLGPSVGWFCRVGWGNWSYDVREEMCRIC